MGRNKHFLRSGIEQNRIEKTVFVPLDSQGEDCFVKPVSFYVHVGVLNECELPAFSKGQKSSKPLPGKNCSGLPAEVNHSWVRKRGAQPPPGTRSPRTARLHTEAGGLGLDPACRPAGVGHRASPFT